MQQLNKQMKNCWFECNTLTTLIISTNMVIFNVFFMKFYVYLLRYIYIFNNKKMNQKKNHYCEDQTRFIRVTNENITTIL